MTKRSGLLPTGVFRYMAVATATIESVLSGLILGTESVLNSHCVVCRSPLTSVVSVRDGLPVGHRPGTRTAWYRSDVPVPLAAAGGIDDLVVHDVACASPSRRRAYPGMCLSKMPSARRQFESGLVSDSCIVAT